ncbi:hypothetical protein, partial [Cryptosporangium minutisporangium]|uniref:hypothetical protein n=1 Tax=Cryptosporangium minutisporangium TaxID=113569 RepID=UPI0035EFDB56
MSDEDICGATAKSTGEPCKRPAGWGTPNNSGRCKFHGGSTPSKDENPDVGPPEGARNGLTHGAYADKSHLYSQVFTDLEREIADDIFTDYVTRYKELHGDIPKGHELRLFKLSVNAVTEIRVENWATDRPETLNTGTPYVDEETHKKTAQMPDGSTRVIEEKRYKKSPALAAKKTLSNENRQWLKDLGLLDDPE